MTPPAAPEEPGIGPYLARQRRLRGISLEDLSNRTRIPLRSLERLESGAFDGAPDGFSRGFVRAVAAALGLDADEAVMRLLREPDAEEAEVHGARRLPPGASLVLGLLLAGAACILGLLIWGVSAWLEREPTPAPPPLVFRRDVVRELVDAPVPGGAPAPQPEGGERAADPP